MNAVATISRRPEWPSKPNYILPEHHLFYSVILLAINDAIEPPTYRKDICPDQIQAQAFAWFRDAGDDFQAVCAFANLNPEYVRKKALKHIIEARRQQGDYD